MPRIGMLGCGNIAGIIADRGGDFVTIDACHDIDEPRMRAFGERVGASACLEMRELLRRDFPVLV